MAHSVSEAAGADAIPSLVASLTLDEKVRLLTGIGTWTLASVPSIGLRSMIVSDGPVGVRGVDEDLRPSAQLPSPTAMAATWDVDLVARVGRLFAAEAHRKGVDVVLAPVVNLQRTPVGGRHFECLSEDPMLTARLAVAFVSALQDAGIGACVKHFVANESETDRTRYVSEVDERTLREVYFAPFEAAVKAGAWTVMAAYNGLNYAGAAAPSTAHRSLLTDLLKEEWRFDGVVMSDWLATRDGIGAALAGLDLVMPGPGGPWADLGTSVLRGDVPESVIDDKVARILRLADRVGALDGGRGRLRRDGDDRAWGGSDLHEHRSLIRDVAARGTVVLRNEGVLPILPGEVTSIALIGANAVKPFVQGGGSASVNPPHVVAPLDALRRAFPGAGVTLHRGGATEQHAPAIPIELLRTPSGENGIRIEHLDSDSRVVAAHLEADPSQIWFKVTDPTIATVRLIADLCLDAGEHEIEVGPVGAHRISVDGRLLSASSTPAGYEVILDSSYSRPRTACATIRLQEPRDVRIEAVLQVVDADAYGRFVRVHLGYRPAESSVDAELAEAVTAAERADVAVVVIGTNAETESEGWDRPNLNLPGRQNDLVRAIASVNPRTVVVVNAGAPVLLPWLDEVPAVLWWWLPGQEAGDSLAVALTGEVEPSGRLPWTLPTSLDEIPVANGVPIDGVIRYTEGLDIGYRGWDRLGRKPAREFGFGLGYTRWDYRAVTILPDDGDSVATAIVEVANIGDRAGREVVQLYASGPEDGWRRPLRWLLGFSTVDVDPGQTGTVRVPIARRSLEVWDTYGRGWVMPDGDYRLFVGRSSRDVRLEAQVRAQDGAIATEA